MPSEGIYKWNLLLGPPAPPGRAGAVLSDGLKFGAFCICRGIFFVARIWSKYCGSALSKWFEHVFGLECATW